jgi:hypothetical protein
MHNKQQTMERREDHHEEVPKNENIPSSQSEGIGVSSLGSLLRKLNPLSSNNKNRGYHQDDSNMIPTDIDEMTQDSSCSSSSSFERHNNCKKNEAKHVSFHRTVARRFTISLEDFTLEEKEAVWWTSKDYIGFRGSCFKQIVKMENGVVFKDRKYCSRGLEGQTRLASIAKLNTRSEAMYAVLDKQDYVRLMKVDLMDRDVSIGQVYRDTASSCQLWACIVGLADARAAAADDEDDLLLPFWKEEEEEDSDVAHVLENMMPVGLSLPRCTTTAKHDFEGTKMFPSPARTENCRTPSPPRPPRCDHAKSA